jgi:hypothetical protein
VNFLLAVSGIFHARHYFGLERVPFLEQLVDTFRIRAFKVGQTLQISGLPGRVWSRTYR